MSKYFILIVLFFHFGLTDHSLNAAASSDGFEIEYAGFYPKVGKRYALGLDYEDPKKDLGFNDFGHVSGGWVFRALRDAGREFSQESVNHNSFFMDMMSSTVTYKKPLCVDVVNEVFFYATLKYTTDMTINCLVEMVRKPSDIEKSNVEEIVYAYGNFVFFGRDKFGKKIVLPEYLQNIADFGGIPWVQEQPITYQFFPLSWPEKLWMKEKNTLKELEQAYIFHVLDVAGKNFCEDILGKDTFGHQRKVVTATSFFEGGIIPSESTLKLRAAFTKLGQKSINCRVEMVSPIDGLVNAFGEFTFVHVIKGNSPDSVIPQTLPVVELAIPKL